VFVGDQTTVGKASEENTDTFIMIGDCSNNANRAVYFTVRIYEARSSTQIAVKIDSSKPASSTNNRPMFDSGWIIYQGGTTTDANGVTGIRMFFESGNVASARWTVRALHRKQ
jgi:hypothetical protein